MASSRCTNANAVPQSANGAASRAARSRPSSRATVSRAPFRTKKPLAASPRRARITPNMWESEESGASSGEGASTSSRTRRSLPRHSGSTPASKAGTSEAS